MQIVLVLVLGWVLYKETRMEEGKVSWRDIKQIICVMGFYLGVSCGVMYQSEVNESMAGELIFFSWLCLVGYIDWKERIISKEYLWVMLPVIGMKYIVMKSSPLAMHEFFWVLGIVGIGSCLKHLITRGDLIISAFLLLFLGIGQGGLVFVIALSGVCFYGVILCIVRQMPLKPSVKTAFVPFVCVGFALTLLLKIGGI